MAGGSERGDTAPETSRALDRGVRVLTLLAERPGGLSVTELAAGVGAARPVVYRIVATLEGHRLVRRGDDGRVRLGLGVLALARRVQPLLRDAAGPVLRDLADRLGATAHLTVVDAGEALAVAVVEPSWTDVHVSYRVGSRHPLDRGAAGRAILAGRRGRLEVVHTTSELQSGAVGMAAPVPLPGLEASVGVVSLGRGSTRAVPGGTADTPGAWAPAGAAGAAQAVLAAARQVAAALG